MANRIMLNETSYHGAGAIQEIANEAKARGFQKAFVCSDPDLIQFKVTAKVTDVLENAGLSYEIYSDTVSYTHLLEAIVDPVSLYEPVYSDGGDTIYVMDQIGDKNAEFNWLEELAMKEAIQGLGEREKRILSLRFLSGKTQMEVAREIGISQAPVSRLEKGALDQIKKQL